MHRYVLLFCAAGFFIKYIIQECNVHQRKTRKKITKELFFQNSSKKNHLYSILIFVQVVSTRGVQKFFSIPILLSVTHCPRSSDPFYMVTYYIKWVTTPWTHRI